MARPKSTVPTYKHHKSTGLARCWVNGKWVSLGKYGSPESKAEFERILAELRTGAPAAQEGKFPEGVTVDTLLVRFWEWAEKHFRRPDGTPTHQLVEYKYALKPLHALYGHTPARDFGPLAFKAVRQKMIEAGWCRAQVNARVSKVRRVFKRAVEEELIPPSVHQALEAVAGLAYGRTEAPESEAIGPVDPAHVDATLPYLSRHIAGMVRFQQLTGCRPGEAVIVRRCDIDTSREVWLYKPTAHKTAWKRKKRVIAIGPKAQEVLKPFFTADLEAYLFSPRRAVEEHHAERSARRKTPLYPSHARHNAERRKKDPKQPAERYTVHAFNNAIRRAVDGVNRAYTEAAVELELHIPRWHVNQLRHSFATAVRKAHGLESAGAALGHTKMSVTEVYAARDEALAARIALTMG